MRESARDLARDARRAVREGTSGIVRRQRACLAEIVDPARMHSPFYREHYGHLPPRVDDPTLLPVTSKKMLMARFDDWVTDGEVTLERIEAFVADPALVGHSFRGRYLGSPSTPMLFGTLLDRVPGVEQFQVLQTAPDSAGAPAAGRRPRVAGGARRDRAPAPRR